MTFAIAVVQLAFAPSQLRAQGKNGGDSKANFRAAVAELSAARLNGAAESENQEEKPLVYLDSIASSILNASAKPDLIVANQTLLALLPDPAPVGENYRLVKLGGTPAAYAMVVKNLDDGDFIRAGDGLRKFVMIDKDQPARVWFDEIALGQHADQDAILVNNWENKRRRTGSSFAGGIQRRVRRKTGERFDHSPDFNSTARQQYGSRGIVR